ncbi:MAG: phage holin family protein [Pseudomonadota bacterium]
MATTNLNTVPALIARLLREAQGLLLTEIAMARKEVAKNLSVAGAGLVFVVAALLFALVAIHALAVAAVVALFELGMPMGWAALFVCTAFAILATIFGIMAKRRLSMRALAPSRTIDSLKTNFEILEETIHADRQHDKA